MKKNKHIAPRGDHFYYIEVWDKAELREAKLSKILDNKDVKPKYVAGSLKRLDIRDTIYTALFWKNESTAEYRIKSLKERKPYKDYTFVIRCLSREEFIKVIPDESKVKYDRFSMQLYEKNKKLKQDEITYKKKIDNPWRNHGKDLNDIL